MTPTPALADLVAAREELEHWFFEIYLPNWIAAVETSDDASFITDYWGAPLWVGDDSGPIWLAETPADVTAWFQATFDRLQAAGYTHTTVLDRRTVAFNAHGGAIDTIWSRRRGDGSEIERVAVHFVIARRTDGIRVITIESHFTDADTLVEVWPVQEGVL